jgi:8-oxo-dGTP diphosphatase
LKRDRAFSAIIHNGKIVMVKVDDKNRSFWTLPGGGIETGESREGAAIREAMEEVNIKIKINRFLFEREYEEGTEYCYLAEPVKGTNIKLGYDPEFEAHEQVLTKAEWKEIKKVQDDLHVSIVLKSLKPEEFIKYNIALDYKGEISNEEKICGSSRLVKNSK